MIWDALYNACTYQYSGEQNFVQVQHGERQGRREGSVARIFFLINNTVRPVAVEQEDDCYDFK